MKSTILPAPDVIAPGPRTEQPGGRKRHRVRLTDDERCELTTLVGRGRAAARTLTRARILLHADEAAGAGRTDEVIAAALLVSVPTIERVRRRFVETGMAALEARSGTRTTVPLLDGAAEARLVALACGAAPAGRARWTLRLLADRLVALDVVGTVSYETVRRTLKKTCSSRG